MYKFYLVLLLLTGLYSVSMSQVTVTIQGVPPQYNINTDEFPLLKLNVKVADGGVPVELTANQFYILEEAMVCEPIEVTPLTGGWQTVKWYTKLNDFTKVGSENKDYIAQLLTVYKNNPDRKLIIGRIEWLPYLMISSSASNGQIRDAYWPNVSPGNSIPFQILINGYLQQLNTFQQENIKIDSVKTNTPYFTFKWLGPLIGEKKEPPAELGVGIDYLVNIYFTPDKGGYFQDVMTIYFNNGMKRHIPLYGNSFKVGIDKLLELTEPLKGTVLATCQDVKIKWKGHDPDNPVEIYYSTDAGYEWKLIDVVKDSSYTWKVPNIETRFLYLKIRQDFKNSKVELLSEDGFPVFSVNYNSPGTILSSVNSMGKIMTWDLVSGSSPALLRRHYIETLIPESEEKFYSFGLEYSNNDDKFFAGYRNYLYPSFLQRDTIAVFTTAETAPVKKIGLPVGFRSKSMKSDRAKKYLTVFPEYGSKLLQYSMQTDELIKEIVFDSPIMDIAYNTNSDSAAVLLINGKIKLVKLDEFTVFDELNFNIFPNFLEIAYSPNGKFIGIGSQADNSGLKTNVYLIDIATRQIVKVFNPSGGNPVALQFNPTSTSLIVGSETDKQIAIFDLTSSQPSSSMFGHNDIMTDLKMSPSGFSIVSTSISRLDNIVYRTFTYPQEDQSTGNLRIEIPKLNTEIVKLPDAYLGTSNKHTITSICNTGLAMADIYEAHFRSSVHYRMTKTWVRDTALAGECLNFDIIFNPLDTGMIRDTLILYHCSKQYFIPFESYSIPRRITLLSNGFDFGDVCIGDTLSKEFPLFRNDDPVPLVLNYTILKVQQDTYFSNIGLVKDTVLLPGEIFIAKFKFIPITLGPSQAEIQIYHSNQKGIYSSSLIKGRGIGSNVQLSHEVLRFIPEINVREITIKNIGLTDVFFDQFRVEPFGAFEVLTPAGFNLKPDEEKVLQISWNGEDEVIAQLIIDANPCLIQRFIQLDFYRGQSVVTLPVVTTEAYNENVKIPILYTNTENGPYEGKRIFEAEFSVNSKLFLPRSIESKYGTATLTSNNVNNGLRTFGIKVEGDFPLSDTVAVITGVAGLSDIDRSALLMSDNSTGWSKFVNTKSLPGEIIIIGICEDRYIIHVGSIIKNILVIPNPVVETAKIRFELTENVTVKCEIIDNSGLSNVMCSDFDGKTGENILDLNLSKFGTGNYKVRIATGNSFITTNLIILR
ncbi:MAG: T9SS type A sorting domain-containing protein [Candidatus Kapabacteria bacterium]|nr:T9SS type A sorting domain-containing protein [Candidatus Kapabacteria bacterium]